MNDELQNQDDGATQEQPVEQPPAADAAASQPTPHELAELRRKAAEYNALMDRLKRVTADFINSQKRLERDMHERAQYTLEGFARELLPVADNLERALSAAKEPDSFEKTLAGIEQIAKQIRDIFAKHGIRPIEARTGDQFNPDIHEAISVMDSADHEPNKVLHEAQKGYTIHSRLLRPTRVVISRKPQQGG